MSITKKHLNQLEKDLVDELNSNKKEILKCINPICLTPVLYVAIWWGNKHTSGSILISAISFRRVDILISGWALHQLVSVSGSL